MPNFTAGTSFTDGVTNDVTAAKLNALIADAVPTSSLSLNSTTGTISQFSSGTGTAASPAIQPTGDTNTGIFFPAADTIAFSEGGTEAMRIDSSGRVGIGTSSPRGRLEVPSTLLSGETGAQCIFPLSVTIGYGGNDYGSIGYNLDYRSATSNTTGVKYLTSDPISQLDFYAGGFIFRNAPSGTGGSAATLTERLRIDSSGNVGIGTASPSKKFAVSSGGAQGIELSPNESGVNRIISYNRSTNLYTDLDIEGLSLRLKTNDGAERLRIDSSGRVGIGTSSPDATLQVVRATSQTDIDGVNQVATFLNTSSDTSGNLTGIRFRQDNATNVAQSFIGLSSTGSSSTRANLIIATPNTAGNATERLRITSGGEVYIAGTTDQGAYNLQVNGTGVWGAGAYVNGSDERLKENIQDITSGLDVVEKLRPVSFQYKEEYAADRSIQSGFIAQDLLVALEGKNYLEGVVSQGPTYYNVAYQNLIPILAKAIQELKAENESLKTRITALEAA